MKNLSLFAGRILEKLIALVRPAGQPLLIPLRTGIISAPEPAPLCGCALRAPSDENARFDSLRFLSTALAAGPSCPLVPHFAWRQDKQ